MGLLDWLTGASKIADHSDVSFNLVRYDHQFRSETGGGPLEVTGYAPAASGASLLRWEDLKLMDDVAAFSTAGTSFYPEAQTATLDDLPTELRLVADFKNPHDRNAVRVETPEGIMLGHVPRRHNREVALLLRQLREPQLRAWGFQVARDPTGDLVYVGVLVPLKARTISIEIDEDNKVIDDES